MFDDRRAQFIIWGCTEHRLPNSITEHMFRKARDLQRSRRKNKKSVSTEKTYNRPVQPTKNGETETIGTSRGKKATSSINRVKLMRPYHQSKAGTKHTCNLIGHYEEENMQPTKYGKTCNKHHKPTKSATTLAAQSIACKQALLGALWRLLIENPRRACSHATQSTKNAIRIKFAQKSYKYTRKRPTRKAQNIQPA